MTVATTPHQRSLSRQQMETTTENRSWTQRKDEVIVQSVAPMGSLPHRASTNGLGNTVEVGGL